MEVYLNGVIIFPVESLLDILSGDVIGIFIDALKEIFNDVLKRIL